MTSRRPECDGLQRAAETDELIDAVRQLVVPFIRAADEAAPQRARGSIDDTTAGTNVLVDANPPETLLEKLALELPDGEGGGRDGLLRLVQRVLKYSVNTWDQGFLDKLYASPTPVGVVAEMLLAVLNTNLHVYQVSPALTVIEKVTAKRLANLFGFTGPRAGGITCQGGSSSNLTSLVIARNTLYPETRDAGNGGRQFVLFTSAHGHYSVRKSAIACGIGGDNVVSVAVDAGGAMIPEELEREIARVADAGMTPLYVNATAGTTVVGSFDPLQPVAAVCRRHRLWMHVDGSWGGAAVFSAKQRHKLAGAHLADSLTVNPHKMMNVTVTCSFLLGPDVGVFHRANTLEAGYLFHDSVPSDGSGESWDLADLTLQCGRKGDSLKLALAWAYYGAAGFERRIDRAFGVAAHLAGMIAEKRDFVLVSAVPPPCLQVCFYHAPGGRLADGSAANTARTTSMVARLVGRGFMVDHAPGERGSFFRVVVNCQTLRGTVEGLLRALEEVGREVVVEGNKPE